MARINNGRNSRRKSALIRLEYQLKICGYQSNMVFIANTPEKVERIKKEIATLKTRIMM